ncbi:MAG TPA: NADH-quinone oxidoreductase subunit C [Acidimicrobiales bacterium]|nr:NADH-quinone oxidoreductase subunit C [Acidimicrobiales bacterium]
MATDTDAAAEEAAPAPAPEPEPERLHGALVANVRGVPVAVATADQYLPLMEGLHADGFDMLADLTAVDFLGHPGRRLPAGVEAGRFEVVATVLSMAERRRVRVRAQVPEAEPRVASVFHLWPGCEAMEREVWDMLGIAFTGHPDLTRILMPEDWEGHPLRKDYPIGRVPVQFKATRNPAR